MLFALVAVPFACAPFAYAAAAASASAENLATVRVSALGGFLASTLATHVSLNAATASSAAATAATAQTQGGSASGTSAAGSGTSAAAAAAVSGSADRLWFQMNTPVTRLQQCATTMLSWQSSGLDTKKITLGLTSVTTGNMETLAQDLPVSPSTYKWIIQSDPDMYFITVTGALNNPVYSGYFNISSGDKGCVGSSSAAGGANKAAATLSGNASSGTTKAPSPASQAAVATVTVMQAAKNAGARLEMWASYIVGAIGFVGLVI